MLKIKIFLVPVNWWLQQQSSRSQATYHIDHKVFLARNFARLATLLKKRLWHRCFLVNFVKFQRTPFYIERPWWLLLHHSIIDGMVWGNIGSNAKYICTLVYFTNWRPFEVLYFNVFEVKSSPTCNIRIIMLW